MIYKAYAICAESAPIDTTSDGTLAVYSKENSSWESLLSEALDHWHADACEVVIVDAKTWNTIMRAAKDLEALRWEDDNG